MRNSGTEDVSRKSVTVFYYTEVNNVPGVIKSEFYNVDLKPIAQSIRQDEYIDALNGCTSEIVLFLDADRVGPNSVGGIIDHYIRSAAGNRTVGYVSDKKEKSFFGIIRNSWSTDPEIQNSPVFIGAKADFCKAYAGADLSGNLFTAIGYSLQKTGVKFCRLEEGGCKGNDGQAGKSRELILNYELKIPAKYLITGRFFKELFQDRGKAGRNMVFRMLTLLFLVFTFLYMPYISRDYGITGDEFPDQRHAGYVLDYFTKGDTTALYQPKTTLHLYGISMQVVAEAVCQAFHIENYYEVRHAVCALNGALGILFVGLLGLRWGGGLCGLMAVLLMFFTPRYFGHSMNNLKDIPFAAGYVMTLFYTVRLFDHYPFFKLRHMLGLVLGIALALGTRSGGLILYPMLLMYAGLFYIQSYGIRNFYKFGKHRSDIGYIFAILIVVGVASYILSILLWPFALQKPFSNVLVSLEQFTHYNIGLRTIFEGKQMMSNMLPWQYAPKYLLIGMPVVCLAGFAGYLIVLLFKKREFSLISYFILFAAVFPVFWVIYKNSNLYGGIRHLLFVMPAMVLLAARFWSLSIEMMRSKWVKMAVVLLFVTGLLLPVVHMVKNHPNDYIYFNEFAGGLKKSYGDYEMDYYYNSLKKSCDWFRKNVDLPKDKKTVVVSNHSGILQYYFRRDTNISVIYSRYYEKYSKDWDYAIMGNVYINRYQLKSGVFPPEGVIYSSDVEGLPMSVVMERDTKEVLEGFKLEQDRKYAEALVVLERYFIQHPKNEEVASRIAKLYYTVGNLQKAEEYGKIALRLHPSLNEALYVQTMVNLRQRRYQEALASAQAILNENEFSPEGYYLKALVYNGMKNYKEAIENVNKTLSMRPKHDGALALAGDIFVKNENYKVAADIYRQLFEIKKSVNEMVLLADCYCRMQDYKQAERLLAEVQKVQGGYFPAYKVWLRMTIQRQDWQSAARLLAQMTRVSDDSELFTLKALLAEGQGQRGQAVGLVKQALELNPDNAEALKLQAKWSKNVQIVK